MVICYRTSTNGTVTLERSSTCIMLVFPGKVYNHAATQKMSSFHETTLFITVLTKTATNVVLD